MFIMDNNAVYRSYFCLTVFSKVFCSVYCISFLVIKMIEIVLQDVLCELKLNVLAELKEVQEFLESCGIAISGNNDFSTLEMLEITVSFVLMFFKTGKSFFKKQCNMTKIHLIMLLFPLLFVYIILILCQSAFQLCLYCISLSIYQVVSKFPEGLFISKLLGEYEVSVLLFPNPNFLWFIFLVIDGNFVATPWILQVYTLKWKHFVLHFSAFIMRLENMIFNKQLIMYRKDIFTTCCYNIIRIKIISLMSDSIIPSVSGDAEKQNTSYTVCGTKCSQGALWHYQVKLKVCTLKDPVVPLLHLHSREILAHVHMKTCKEVHSTTQEQMRNKRSSVGQWILTFIQWNCMQQYKINLLCNMDDF